MAKITLKGNAIHTVGSLPGKGSQAADVRLTRGDLSDVSLTAWAGKKKVFNVFPSIDTPTCAASVRRFNQEAAGLANVAVLCVSADLPFAQQRFCAAEGLKDVECLSTFRGTFAKDYGLEVTDGPLAGLCSRAVVVLDEENRVLYSEQVAEIAHEPNYELALASLGKR